MPIESVEHACRAFLALGPGIEVLEPPALRARLARAARATAALYGPAHDGPWRRPALTATHPTRLRYDPDTEGE